MNLLADAGAKFNTTENALANLKIPYSFINQLNTISSFLISQIFYNINHEGEKNVLKSKVNIILFYNKKSKLIRVKWN